jgi:glycosyltransferase involved in cell wall biosynthesis
MPLLSVIIPAYNEEDNIVAALDDVVRDVASCVPDLEILVIDDGSRDRTTELARQVAARDPRIVVVSQANQGHGPAVVHGLRKARGEWILLLDSDRQIVLSRFEQHWAMTRTYDVVLGLRRPRRDPWHRLLISAAMRWLLLARLRVNLGDAGAPYKLMRARLWAEAEPMMRQPCWVPSILLAATARLEPDVRSIEVPVEHRPRAHGESTLNLRRLARFCREGVTDVAYFRDRWKRRKSEPSRDPVRLS